MADADSDDAVHSSTETSAGPDNAAPRKRRRGSVQRPFPASTLEDAMYLAEGIQKFAAGQKIRRLTLFDKLGKSAGSGPSRQLVSNSSRYGLTTGNYHSEYLDLTPDGAIATSSEGDPEKRLRARFKLGIEDLEPFQVLYERYKNNKLPAQAVLRDALLEIGVPEEYASEGVDTFILNAKFLGLLREIAGAERVLPIEHVLEEMPRPVTRPAAAASAASTASGEALSLSTVPVPVAERGDTPWDAVCFYISPIGESDSDHRHHSDLFFSSIVEPALSEFDLKLIRADQIAQPGMITRQIIEHVVHARLVVADLSFHNPNVFYELSLRHACRKPTVQLVREGDKIPFDIDQVRTIRIDTTSIYTLVPKLETYRSEIATQVRRALADPDAVDNPISIFMPTLRATVKSA